MVSPVIYERFTVVSCVFLGISFRGRTVFSPQTHKTQPEVEICTFIRISRPLSGNTFDKSQWFCAYFVVLSPYTFRRKPLWSLYNRYCVLRNALYCVEICSLSEAQLLQKVRRAFIGLSLARPETHIVDFSIPIEILFVVFADGAQHMARVSYRHYVSAMMDSSVGS